MVSHGVTMDLQKKSFIIEPAKSCPHCLKILSWKELGHLVQKYRISFLKKTFFLICCQTLEITDTMTDNIETKTENLRLQKCSLKNGYFWKLVISLETYMKERQ